MPGLPKRQSYALLHGTDEHHESGITALLPPQKPPTSTTMAQSIRYIPPQMDPMASLSTRSARQNPIFLILQDAFVLITNLRYLPGTFLPFGTKDPSNELYLDPSGVREQVLQGGLFVMEIVILLLAIPTILILPGVLSTAICTVCCLTVYLLCSPIEGPKVIYSNMSEETLGQAEQHKNERWLFINGCMVGNAGFQKNIDRIAKTFGRAVIGIHNTTWGLPFDILECLVQRAFSYQTQDVRVAHSYIKATLIDPTVSKVVIIGHSQGGIIASLVIDQLFAELPTDCMSKIEVYTFGSAASHFSNTLLSPSAKTDADGPSSSPTNVRFDRPTQPKQVISHIEHYANENDMVPRWGVLHCTQDVLNNRYAGCVFVRAGASGHMFNQHYMDPMFPLPEKTHWPQNSFFDKIIQVDDKLAMRRESTALSNWSLMRRESGLEFGDGEVVPETQILPDGTNGGSSSNDDPILIFARTDSSRLSVEEARGKTVRELSRLWRYQGGRSPPTPTPTPSPTIESGHRWASEENEESNKKQSFAPLNFTGETSGTLTRYQTALMGESNS